jgi:hypothetical protein
LAKRPTTRQMSDKHEDYLADALDGRKTVGSGNQFNDPMDGRNKRYDQPFALAWDGKSTLAASITMTKKTWAKAVEQSKGEIPMLALRWYGDYRLEPDLDLAVLDMRDFTEILEAARKWAAMERSLKQS